MSRSRRIKQKETVARAQLNVLLEDFFAFLGSRPKPTDERVRSTFSAYVRQWLDICRKNDLDDQSGHAFKTEVAKVWEQKKQESQQKKKLEEEGI